MAKYVVQVAELVALCRGNVALSYGLVNGLDEQTDAVVDIAVVAVSGLSKDLERSTNITPSDIMQEASRSEL